jgi:hypothetical protein
VGGGNKHLYNTNNIRDQGARGWRARLSVARLMSRPGPPRSTQVHPGPPRSTQVHPESQTCAQRQTARARS